VRKGYSADQEVTVATGKGFRIPGGGNVVEFPDLAPPGSSRLSGGRSGLMSPEIGTQFDWGQRLFAYYGEGDVFDYGEWNSRDMKTMFSRDGVSAALAAALTLPIRGAPVKIDPAKGDKGEAEFITSVLMTPDTEGGMKTPVKELIGQVTSAQLYRRAFFEKTFKVRESDEKVIYDKIAYRPPATCQARFNDRSGENNGFRQQVWLFGGNLMLDRKQKVPGYVDIPRVRSFIYTHGKYREPMTGVSEMDIAYWPWAHGTRVPTPDGFTVIEDLHPGDTVFGVDGQPVQVTAIHPQGKRQMYRVTMRDGSSAECGADHIWGVYDAQRGNRYHEVTTSEMIGTGLRRGTSKPLWRYSIPRCAPVEYAERALPIDPYILGAWLGDGTMQRAADGVRRYGPRLAAQAYGGWIAGEVAARLPDDMRLARSADDYLFLPVVARDTNWARDALVGLGVNLPSPERFIPELYLQASVKQRLDLLRGLMDTDGSAESGNHARYHTKSPRLAADVRELVRSLGGTAIIRKIATRDVLRVEIQAEDCPFLLPEKAARWSRGARRKASAVVSIEPTTVQDCRCITVDRPDGLFLVNEYLTGHNCYQTKMKLLYLWYHFLENQALPRTVVYGNDQPEANTRADNIAALKSSGVVGMERPPEGGKAFDILEPSGDGGSFFSAALTFLEEWQVMSVLAGFLNLVSSGSRSSSGGASGSSKGGSYAMSADQSSYFMASRSTIADEIAEAMSYDVIRPLIIMNFGSGAAFPQWKFGPMDDSDSQQLLTLFGQLAAAPTMNIPIPVFDLICERMANILNLNEDQVAQALASTASQRAEQLAGQAPPGMPPEAAAAIGGLNGMASAAMGIAQQAGATNNGSSNSGLRPPPAPGARAPGVPQRPAAPPAPPAQGPPTPPNTPPMSPVPGKLTR
jgi:LAGLIDADG-like domain